MCKCDAEDSLQPFPAPITCRTVTIISPPELNCMKHGISSVIGVRDEEMEKQTSTVSFHLQTVILVSCYVLEWLIPPSMFLVVATHSASVFSCMTQTLCLMELSIFLQ